MKASLPVSEHRGECCGGGRQGRRTGAGGSGGLTHHSIYVPVRPSFAVGRSVGRSADAMVIGVSAMRQLTYVCGGRLEGRTHVGREPTHHVLLRLRAGP